MTELWTFIGAVVGAAATLIGVILALPKLRSEARKLNAEAGHLEWQTLRDEINRLQERLEKQDARIAELEKLDDERADREAELVKENRQLRQKVKRLEDRIEGLEAIFKIGPVTPEMQAELDKLKKIE